MAKLNLHGLKINGIKKASGETRDSHGLVTEYYDVFYHLETGDVWAKYNVGQSWHTVYNDKAIVWVCNDKRHMSMQEIADAIWKRISLLKCI